MSDRERTDLIIAWTTVLAMIVCGVVVQLVAWTSGS